MKSFLFIIVSVGLFFACIESPQTHSAKETGDTAKTSVNKSSAKTPDSYSALNNLFTLPDAERILGEPATITDSTMSRQQNIMAYKSAYEAKSNGAKKGNVYFLIEEFSLLTDAQNKYAFIKASNENSGGFKVLEGVGDEAYFHSDNENFYFTMVRKGKKVFNMKVNKITPKTSLDAFNDTAKKIALSI